MLPPASCLLPPAPCTLPPASSIILTISQTQCSANSVGIYSIKNIYLQNLLNAVTHKQLKLGWLRSNQNVKKGVSKGELAKWGKVSLRQAHVYIYFFLIKEYFLFAYTMYNILCQPLLCCVLLQCNLLHSVQQWIAMWWENGSHLKYITNVNVSIGEYAGSQGCEKYNITALGFPSSPLAVSDLWNP